MTRPVDMLAEAIESEFPDLGATVFEGGRRLIVSRRDDPTIPLVTVDLAHDDDVDEIAYWLTEAVRDRDKRRPIRSLSEVVSEAVDEATDPERADRRPFPRPACEPRSLRGLPKALATEYRRRVLYRLMLCGYAGPQLRLELARALSEAFPPRAVDGDIEAIAAELRRSYETERSIRRHLQEQLLSRAALHLWEMGEYRIWDSTMRTLVKLTGLPADKKDLRDIDPFDGWSREEISRYNTTREVPEGKTAPRFH